MMPPRSRKDLKQRSKVKKEEELDNEPEEHHPLVKYFSQSPTRSEHCSRIDYNAACDMALLDSLHVTTDYSSGEGSNRHSPVRSPLRGHF